MTVVYKLSLYGGNVALKLNMILMVLVLATSCVTVKDSEISDKKVEEVSFSIAQTKSPSGDFVLVGSSSTCSIKWTVSQGILTHRMNCNDVKEDELWAYLLGMSSKLKAENTKLFYFVRYTSKDFQNEEAYLGKIFSKSKVWKRFNTKNIKQEKYKKISNEFLKRVVEQKGVLSLVPKALNSVGYNFVVDRVEIEKYRLQKNKILRPTETKVVFKKANLKILD